MMALDPINVLDTWPLPNLLKFVEKCVEQDIKEVNLTGSNTDPLLYKHIPKLLKFLREFIPGVKIGIRTNGVAAIDFYSNSRHNLYQFDKISISIPSFDSEKYKQIMGEKPISIEVIKDIQSYCDRNNIPLKINIVLCPEILEDQGLDLCKTLWSLWNAGVKKINLREPYGQPHIGDPFENKNNFYLERLGIIKQDNLFGMHRYKYRTSEIVYWDVHYVEVESLNLYANGEISEDYPVTRGHDPVSGKVEGQENFTKSGRIREQWVKLLIGE